MWCSDITYIPVQDGLLYLVAIMDWASRRVLAWRLSNTMDTEFCLEALTEALAQHGAGDIQHRSGQPVHQHHVHGSAGGRRHPVLDGRPRSVSGQRVHRAAVAIAEVQAVYLHELADGFAAQRVIDDWMEYYNEVRPHSALAGRTPVEAYRDGGTELEKEVA